MSGARWFSDVYRDAVWEAETLTAAEKAVAETYARHVRNAKGVRSPEADLAWLTYERIMAKAGIGRRANVAAATASLVKAGWLVVHQEVNRRPTVYRLAVPLLGSSTTGTTDASSDGGTTVVPLSDLGSSTLSGSTQAGSSDGGTPLLEDLPLKRSPSSSSGSAPTEAIRARLGAGLDDDEVDWLHQKIKDMAGGPIRKSFAAYLRGIPDADLDEYRRQYRERHATGPASRFRAGPDGYVADSRQHGRWCGQCDQRERVIQVGSPSHPKEKPCPTCHKDRVTGPPVEGWSTSKPQRLRGLDSRDGSTDWDDPDLLKF